MIILLYEVVADPYSQPKEENQPNYFISKSKKEYKYYYRPAIILDSALINSAPIIVPIEE